MPHLSIECLIICHGKTRGVPACGRGDQAVPSKKKRSSHGLTYDPDPSLHRHTFSCRNALDSFRPKSPASASRFKP
jgi:hypothetical protein